MTDNLPVHCPLTNCHVTIEGMREQPHADAGPRIASVLGVPTDFFGNQWMFEEAQRIEKELKEHLESHTVLEFVTEIVGLQKRLLNARALGFEVTPVPSTDNDQTFGGDGTQ